MYAKAPYEAKYQYLINIREKVRIDHHDDLKAYIEYSNDIHEIYKNINEYNPDKENKIIVVFDDMTADMINNKKPNSIVTELFIRGSKLNISIVFMTQSYFKVPKNVTLKTNHFFIAKILNKKELREIERNHSLDKPYKCKPYSFFVNDTTLTLDSPLRFRKILFRIK